MKKVVVLKALPQNLSLEEAEPDLFHDDDNLALDFEFEELESRLALSNSCTDARDRLALLDPRWGNWTC